MRRPLAEYLGDRIYELRPKHIRVLYAFLGKQYAVILHAFRKETGPVPTRDKRLAKARRADFIERVEHGLIRWKGSAE